jgi:5-methylcytosine-specific restriction endonuclease McrA
MPEIGDLLSCKWCDKTFGYSALSRVYCSYPCRKAANIQRGIDKWAKENPKPDNWDFDCDDCGVLVAREIFLSPGKGRFCAACSKRRKTERYRKKTVKRQGIVKPGNVFYEEIFARDKGICYLCNEVVNPSLPRVSAGGGTIDHVIPISKGGLDTMENCKLAHWSCNNRKSNKLIEGHNA